MHIIYGHMPSYAYCVIPSSSRHRRSPPAASHRLAPQKNAAAGLGVTASCDGEAPVCGGGAGRFVVLVNAGRGRGVAGIGRRGGAGRGRWEGRGGVQVRAFLFCSVCCAWFWRVVVVVVFCPPPFPFRFACIYSWVKAAKTII